MVHYNFLVLATVVQAKRQWSKLTDASSHAGSDKAMAPDTTQPAKKGRQQTSDLGSHSAYRCIRVARAEVSIIFYVL